MNEDDRLQAECEEVEKERQFQQGAKGLKGDRLLVYYLNGIRQAINAGSKNIGKWLGIQDATIAKGFEKVVEALGNQQPSPRPKQLEVLMSFIVPDDQPDVAYTLTLGAVTDAEGNPVTDPGSLAIEVVSDNPDAVAVTPDADPKTGNVHFGAPGNATITANVKDAKGNLLGSGVAGFVVTAGAPAAIAGVKLDFAGLTETPPVA